MIMRMQARLHNKRAGFRFLLEERNQMNDKTTALVALVSISVLSTSTAMARNLRGAPGKSSVAPAAAAPVGFNRGGSPARSFNQNQGMSSSGGSGFGRHGSNMNNRANNAANYQPAPNQSSSAPSSYPASAPAGAYPSYPAATTTAAVPPPGTYNINVAPPYASQAYAQQQYSPPPGAIIGGAMLGGMMGGALRSQGQSQGQGQDSGTTVTNNYYNSPSSTPTGAPATPANQMNGATNQATPTNVQSQPMGRGLQRFLQARQSFTQQYPSQ
jgi:hypothetical protein